MKHSEFDIEKVTFASRRSARKDSLLSKKLGVRVLVYKDKRSSSLVLNVYLSKSWMEDARLKLRDRVEVGYLNGTLFIKFSENGYLITNGGSASPNGRIQCKVKNEWGIKHEYLGKMSSWKMSNGFVAVELEECL